MTDLAVAPAEEGAAESARASHAAKGTRKCRVVFGRFAERRCLGPHVELPWPPSMRPRIVPRATKADDGRCECRLRPDCGDYDGACAAGNRRRQNRSDRPMCIPSVSMRALSPIPNKVASSISLVWRA